MLALCLAALAGLHGAAVAQQEALVLNVPYHRQVTEWSCGDASLHMALHNTGPDVDQYGVIDVLRTTSEQGTLSYDMARGFHFSAISAAPRVPNLFPDHSPAQGWPGRPLGRAAFLRRGTECWLGDLRAALRHGAPLVLLMHYSDPAEHDGHFRVAVGFNDTGILLLDPWDRTNFRIGAPRDQQPRLVAYSDAQMCALWNYSEANGRDRLQPYFAAQGLPWAVQVTYFEAEELTVTATIRYDCAQPLCAYAYGSNATRAVASISYPSFMALRSPQAVELGELGPGAVRTAVWRLAVPMESSGTPYPRSPITVTAQGLVAASMPPYNDPSMPPYSPGYDYSDWIGGVGQALY